MNRCPWCMCNDKMIRSRRKIEAVMERNSKQMSFILEREV